MTLGNRLPVLIAVLIVDTKLKGNRTVVPIAFLVRLKDLRNRRFFFARGAELNRRKQSYEVTVVNAGRGPCNDNAPR